MTAISRAAAVATGRPNRVLIVGTFLSARYGLRSVCEDLADRLSAAGDVVLTTSGRATPLGRLSDMLWTAWTKRHSYAVAQIDVFSGRAFLWAELVSALMRRARKPYALTMHSGNLPEFGRRWPRRMRRLLAHADVVTAPSEYLKEHLRSYRSDIHLIPNAVDLEVYPSLPRRAASPMLVWLRAFHNVYNPVLAIEAIRLVRDEIPNIHMLMIGPDKGDGTLQTVEETIQRHGLSNHVTVQGAIPKRRIPEYLRARDIFIHTSNVDNCPVTVIEAMAAGLCIVATRVGGIPYMLRDGVDSVIIPPDSPEALASAIRRILSDGQLADRLSTNARHEADRYGWDAVLGQWRDLLSGLATATA